MLPFRTSFIAFIAHFGNSGVLGLMIPGCFLCTIFSLESKSNVASLSTAFGFVED